MLHFYLVVLVYVLGFLSISLFFRGEQGSLPLHKMQTFTSVVPNMRKSPIISENAYVLNDAPDCLFLVIFFRL